MNSSLKLVATFVAAASIVAIGGCKSKDQAGKKEGAAATTSPPPATDSSQPATASESPSPSGDCTSTETQSDSTLELTSASPSWDSDIQSIMESRCINCHKPGKSLPDLSTFAKSKAKGSSIVSSINGGDMPPTDSSQLTSAEKTAIKNWVTAGAPQSSSSTSSGCVKTDEPIDDGTTGETDTTDTDDTSDTDGAVSSWEEFLNPKELTDCHDEGKIYDRKTETCHKARIAELYECTRTGIINYFKKFNVSVTANLDKLKDDGYKIDQCGEFKQVKADTANNHPKETSYYPLVMFYKKLSSSSDEYKLSVKKVCKAETSVCTND